MAMAATGMLTSRHQRQSAYSVSTPPSSRPTADATAGDRAVHGEGLGPLGGLGEQDGEQRQRGRGEQRAEGALQRAGGEEHARRSVARPPSAEASAKPVMPTRNVRLRPQ